MLRQRAPQGGSVRTDWRVSTKAAGGRGQPSRNHHPWTPEKLGSAIPWRDVHWGPALGLWDGAHFPDAGTERRCLTPGAVFARDVRSVPHAPKRCSRHKWGSLPAPRPLAQRLTRDRTHLPQPEEGRSQGGQGLGELAGAHVGDVVLGQAAGTERGEGLRANLSPSLASPGAELRNSHFLPRWPRAANT